MAESGCLKDGCFQNLQVEGNTQLNGGSFEGNLQVEGTLQVTGNTQLSTLFTLNGIPLSGSTEGSFKGEAEPGALCQDTTNMSLYMNEGTKASPYWTPLSSVYGNGGGFNGGARMVSLQHSDVVAVTGSDSSVTLSSGVRVFGQGHNENGTGLVDVSASGTIGPLKQLITASSPPALAVALGMGTSTPIHQPDTNGNIVIDIEFTNNTAISDRSLFCGFIGTAADAKDQTATSSSTTITFVDDDLAGAFLDTDLTSADSIYFISNKSSAASSVETTGSINGQAVDILETIPAAATFTRWRIQCNRTGGVTFFINKVEKAHNSAALDADEELHPVFMVASKSGEIKVDVRRFSIWSGNSTA